MDGAVDAVSARAMTVEIFVLKHCWRTDCRLFSAISIAGLQALFSLYSRNFSSWLRTRCLATILHGRIRCCSSIPGRTGLMIDSDRVYFENFTSGIRVLYFMGLVGLSRVIVQNVWTSSLYHMDLT